MKGGSRGILPADLPDTFWLSVMQQLDSLSVGSLVRAFPTLSSLCFDPSLFREDCCLSSKTWSYLCRVLHELAEWVGAPPQLFHMLVRPRKSHRFPITVVITLAVQEWFGQDAEALSARFEEEINSQIKSKRVSGGLVAMVRAERGQLRVALETEKVMDMYQKAKKRSFPVNTTRGVSEMTMCHRIEEVTEYIQRHSEMSAAFGVEVLREAAEIMTMVALRISEATMTQSMRQSGFRLRAKDVQDTFLNTLLPYLCLSVQEVRGRVLFSEKDCRKLLFTRRQAAIVLNCTRLYTVHAVHPNQFQEILEDILRVAQEVCMGDMSSDILSCLRQAFHPEEHSRMKRIQCSNHFILRQAVSTIRHALVLLGANEKSLNRLDSLLLECSLE